MQCKTNNLYLLYKNIRDSADPLSSRNINNIEVGQAQIFTDIYTDTYKVNRRLEEKKSKKKMIILY